MPKDKNPVERYRRITEIFHRRRGSRSVVRMKDLADELGISIRQLGVDMQYMRSKGAPLEYVAADRGWRFQEGRDFAFVDDQILSDEDVMNIRIAIETFNKINNQGQSMGDLPKIFHKIYKAARKWTKPGSLQKFIYFDPLPQYEGSKHIRFFLQSIEDSRRVEFQYQAFHSPTPKTVVFDPWFLRHYDRRWYVGGFSHDPSEQFVRVFPLERIEGIPRNIGYYHDKPPDYDAGNYWRHIYGITVPPNGAVEQIVLEFSPIQGKYFLSSPFIEPFEVLESDQERLVIGLNLIVNIDLVRKLASFGADVRVLKPQNLADTLKRFFEAALAHAR